MERRPRDLSLPHLRDLLARRSDPYGGMDLEPCRRVGGVCWGFGGVVSVLLMLVAPPTGAIGHAGWYVALSVTAISFLGAFVLLRRGSRVGFGGLLFCSYVGIAQIAIVEWLAGGHDTPYRLLYLVAAILPPAVHPPRRAAVLLAASLIALAAPLAYESASAILVSELLLQAAFTCLLAFVVWASSGCIADHDNPYLENMDEEAEIERSGYRSRTLDRLLADHVLQAGGLAGAHRRAEQAR